MKHILDHAKNINTIKLVRIILVIISTLLLSYILLVERRHHKKLSWLKNNFLIIFIIILITIFIFFIGDILFPGGYINKLITKKCRENRYKHPLIWVLIGAIIGGIIAVIMYLFFRYS